MSKIAIIIDTNSRAFRDREGLEVLLVLKGFLKECGGFEWGKIIGL